MLTRNQTILFQGDSITDCCRNREAAEIPNDPGGLGDGYPMMVAAELLGARSADAPRVFNRGVSGNRIVDLDARIKSDIINLKPDLLSILVGVNDTWHERSSRNGVDPAKYERVYRALLQEVKEALPEITFVLCEPFVLQCGVVTEEWVAEIDQRRAIVARLAREFDALLVPFQSMFDEALKQAPPSHWAGDGVHPTIAGHLLMAKCWLQETGSL